MKSIRARRERQRGAWGLRGAGASAAKRVAVSRNPMVKQQIVAGLARLRSGGFA